MAPARGWTARNSRAAARISASEWAAGFTVTGAVLVASATMAVMLAGTAPFQYSATWSPDSSMPAYPAYARVSTAQRIRVAAATNGCCSPDDILR